MEGFWINFIIYIDVNFYYERLYNCDIRIDTNEPLNYDEIKNRIIDELNN